MAMPCLANSIGNMHDASYLRPAEGDTELFDFEFKDEIESKDASKAISISESSDGRIEIIPLSKEFKSTDATHSEYVDSRDWGCESLSLSSLDRSIYSRMEILAIAV